MTRGIHTTTFVEPMDSVDEATLWATLDAAYGKEPFVRVRRELPDTKHVTGTNFCDVSIRMDSRTGRAILLSAEDNLVKGASGQAVQNFNLMASLPETSGLL
jgi:N-acetyl-gamma-glutamyl-phosphate reductase